MTDLYNKGYDFKNKSNLSVQKIYAPKSANIMVEHLITGI